MVKLQKNLVKGDIIRVEYGDYDNWVTLVVDKVEIIDESYLNCKLYCHYLSDGEPVEMYGREYDSVEVL